MNMELIDRATDIMLERIEGLMVSAVQENGPGVVEECDEIIALCNKIKQSVAGNA